MLNWGFIGAGDITCAFCNGMRSSNTEQILAVDSYNQSRTGRIITDFVSSMPGERCARMPEHMAEHWRNP